MSETPLEEGPPIFMLQIDKHFSELNAKVIALEKRVKTLESFKSDLQEVAGQLANDFQLLSEGE
jgi:chaperonin cofactor prefoldin